MNYGILIFCCYVLDMLIIPILPISKVFRIALIFSVLLVYTLLVVKNGKI